MLMPNRSLFCDKRSMLLSKIGVCFLKIGVCFFETRSLFFWKSGFDFWKSEFVFFSKSEFFQNPSIGPRFWAAILLLSSNKITGGSREGGGEPAPPAPAFIFGPNWGPKGRKKTFWRPSPSLSQGLDDPPPPYLKVFIPVFVHIWK